MNYNTIPNTDLQVSQLCMGTATFGQEMLDEDAHKMLDMACKQYGINFLVRDAASQCCAAEALISANCACLNPSQDTAEFFPHPRELKNDWGIAEE